MYGERTNLILSEEIKYFKKVKKRTMNMASNIEY